MNTSQPSDAPSQTGNLIRLLLYVGLPVFAVGALLGFFPGLLAEDGSFAQGIDRGWKTAFVFTAAMSVIGLLYALLKKTRLPAIVISIAMGMAGMAIMFTFGRMITGEGESWQQNLLSGLGNGAIMGAAVHGALAWQAKRAARG